MIVALLKYFTQGDPDNNGQNWESNPAVWLRRLQLNSCPIPALRCYVASPNLMLLEGMLSGWSQTWKTTWRKTKRTTAVYQRVEKAQEEM